MVADLQRYARELQTSAYAATDLNAATFTDKKAELQASLQTDIQRWQNSGLFGSDFHAAVNQAKQMLDEALDPTDLDACLLYTSTFECEIMRDADTGSMIQMVKY